MRERFRWGGFEGYGRIGRLRFVFFRWNYFLVRLFRIEVFVSFLEFFRSFIRIRKRSFFF